MGRPNCSRVRACSAAVSTHHRAPPTASADRTTRARSRTVPVGTSRARSAPTTAEASVHDATGRVGSKLFSWATSVASARSSTTQRTPLPTATGASTWVTTAPCTRGRRVPVTRSEPSGPGSPTRPCGRHRRTVGRGDGEGERRRHGPVGQAGQERLGQHPATCGRHHGGDHHRGVPRADGGGAAELLGHHGQLDDAGSLSAELVRHVDAQQALCGEVGPVGGHGVGVGVERHPHGRRDVAGLRPPLDGGPELLVLLLDPDGHRLRPRRGAAGGRSRRPTMTR